MRLLASFILLSLVLDDVHADVELLPRKHYATSACNASVTYDRVLLKRMTLLSKYIFTGKVFGVNSGHNGSRVYKVNIRRVLKGDLNDIGVVVKFGVARSLRFSDATVYVENSSDVMCPLLRVRTYGIFLTEKRRHRRALQLSLIAEPLVLTVRSIDIIEAAVKGTYSNFVRIGSKRYLFPEVPNLKLQMYSIYNMALTSTDIFVSTFPRSGTTLTQELVWLVANNLDYNTAKSKNLIERYTALGSYIVNPQIEFTRLDKYKQADCSNLDILIKMITPPSEDLVASVGGRFIKNHLPLSLLPPNTLDTAKMIYVARDPRDVAVSLYFLSKLLVLFDFDGDFETFWDLFVRDLIVRTPYFEQVKEAWAMRNHPNMLFIFYDDLVKDMTTTIRKISRFLNKNYSNEQINGLKQHLQLENFRNNGSVTWDFIVEFNALNLSAAPFIRKGRVGGWRDHFNKDMAEQAEIWIQQNLYDTDLKFPLS